MGRILRVLQVEDSPDDAELILRELRRAGYEIDALCVSSSSGMVNALCDRDWDIVLSDFQIPGFGGMEALRVLKASGIDIPFIVVTGAIGEEIAVATMKAGAHDYVFKGNLARLNPAIERELKEAGIRQQQRAADTAMRESERRYRDLFEHSPIPIWVEDFSEMKALFDQYSAQGVRDFRLFFSAHPEELRRCGSSIRVLEVNEPSLRLFGCKQKADIPAYLHSFFFSDSLPCFQDAVVALAEGAVTFSCEVPVHLADGLSRTLSLHLSVSPGFEKNLARVLVSFTDITDRIEHEAALLEARTKFERAQALAHIGSWEWNTMSAHLAWSPELFNIFGVDSGGESPTYDRFIELIHSDDRRIVLGAIEQVIASGQAAAMEFRIRRFDGETRHVRGLVEKMPGIPARVIGTVQDISQEREADERLRRSQAQMAAVLENTEDIIVSRDLQGRCVYFNSAFARLVRASLGVEASPCLRTMDHLPLDAREHWTAVFDAVHVGRSHREEFSWQVEGQGPKHYETVIRPIWQDGRVIGSIETNHDISERKVAELAVRAARDELERFFSLVPDLVCVATAEGYFTRLNPVWVDLLGYPKEELLRRPYLSFVHPEDVESTRCEMDRQAQGHPTIRFVNRYCCRDGSFRWLEWNSTPVLEGQTFAAARDITDRKQLETILQDMEKLSAKSQMAAYIAHEINNPLAGIKNAFALIEPMLAVDHPHYRYVDLIKRELDRIAGIIRTMYHVYRPPTTTSRDVSLLEAFQDIESLLVPKCRSAGVGMQLELEDKRFTIHMNEGLLRQVLFNLVQNAVEASPPGSRVILKAANTLEGSVIAVQDMGHGVPPELRDRIFQSGFTTKNDSEMNGLGLGLSACRNIVESFGGTLDFRPNEDGRGVCFEIFLPEART